MVSSSNIKDFAVFNSHSDYHDNNFFCKILESIIDIAQNHLGYDKGLIFLANGKKDKLLFGAEFGFNKDITFFLSQHHFCCSRPSDNEIFTDSFINRNSFLINSIDSHEEELSPLTVSFAEKLGIKSLLCCPIICGSETLGVLAVDNYRVKKKLIPADLNILKNLAFVIGIVISNKGIATSEFCYLNEMVNTLAGSIDLRDPLSAGHSEKVTEYALGICRELGLSDGFRELIEVAATLHDYGKKNIPASLLKKKTSLTRNEYEHLKTHAGKTRESLEKVNFTGKFRLVPKIAGSHHERIDGNGYPDGLKGNQIPLGSRIIAVADYFDAITSTRHYRNPMPIDKALSLLHEESSLHFDKKIVLAFARYLNKNHPESNLDLILEAKKPEPALA